VRDRALTLVADWLGQLEDAVLGAQTEGTVDAGEDAVQLAFELDAYLLLANAQFVATGDPGALERARTAIDRRLAIAAPEAA
jgi:hypothetical protein